MKIIDYGQSWVTTVGKVGGTRFWIESRCRIIDEQNGTTEDYYQCGACKSEDTFGKGPQLFYEDNYDFLPAYSEKSAVIFRRHVYLDEGYRQIRRTYRSWDVVKFDLVEPPVTQELPSNAEIRAATHARLPLVSQTEIQNDETGLQAIIECPVKSMNFWDEKDIYQVDDGPVILPDLTKRHEHPAEGFKLAFIAFSAPDVASFVCEVPTPIIKDGKELTRIYHYSERHSLPAKNTIYCIGKL